MTAKVVPTQEVAGRNAPTLANLVYIKRLTNHLTQTLANHISQSCRCERLTNHLTETLTNLLTYPKDYLIHIQSLYNHCKILPAVESRGSLLRFEHSGISLNRDPRDVNKALSDYLVEIQLSPCYGFENRDVGKAYGSEELCSKYSCVVNIQRRSICTTHKSLRQ